MLKIMHALATAFPALELEELAGTENLASGFWRIRSFAPDRVRTAWGLSRIRIDHLTMNINFNNAFDSSSALLIPIQ